MPPEEKPKLGYCRKETAMRENIVLTGFMGTGKSVVGRKLSELLHMDFLDTDEEIEKQHGSIEDIFRLHGEQFFRDCEQKISQQLSKSSNTVIATGGGLMINKQNADVLSSSGRVFCLKASLEEITNRLDRSENAPIRPLLHSKDREATMKSLLDERNVHYERFEQVLTDGKSAAAVAEEIVNRINNDGT